MWWRGSVGWGPTACAKALTGTSAHQFLTGDTLTGHKLLCSHPVKLRTQLDPQGPTGSGM